LTGVRKKEQPHQYSWDEVMPFVQHALEIVIGTYHLTDDGQRRILSVHLDHRKHNKDLRPDSSRLAQSVDFDFVWTHDAVKNMQRDIRRLSGLDRLTRWDPTGEPQPLTVEHLKTVLFAIWWLTPGMFSGTRPNFI
jgi:hypothetical protein